MIVTESPPRYEVLLPLGAVAAAALTFRHWGLTGPFIVAVITLAIGASRRLPASVALAVASAAAAGFVHFAVAPEHFGEWWGFGTFFVLCGEVQVGWALLVRRTQTPPALLVGLVGSLLLVALWAASRTSGLPLGPEPWVPEAVGAPDVLAVLLELLTAASCGWALSRRRASVLARPIVICALVLTALTAGWALAAIGQGT